MIVAIGITGLKEHINVGRTLELDGELYKVLNVADCEIDGRQGQTMICELVPHYTVVHHNIVEHPNTFEKVKLHNNNNDMQIIAELPMLDKLPEVEKDERTIALVCNDETYTFIVDAYRNNDVISIYHEVLSDKEFKNMRITKYEYDNGLIKVWFRCLK